MTLVNVRWFDSYLEVFECQQVRQGSDILWLRLTNGDNRTIPLKRVRWFSTDPESHQYHKDDNIDNPESHQYRLYHCLYNLKGSKK